MYRRLLLEYRVLWLINTLNTRERSNYLSEIIVVGILTVSM
jgi:hypothetical protein